jgi:hypothetical protein
LEWFTSVVAARQKYGFKVLFAYADRQNNEFVWAVSHDGDFDAVVEEYQTSPERARLRGRPSARHEGARGDGRARYCGGAVELSAACGPCAGTTRSGASSDAVAGST